MFRLTAVVLALALFACLGHAQDSPQTRPDAAAPPRPRTPQDVVKLAEQMAARVTELIQAGNTAEAGRLASEALSALDAVLQAEPQNVDARVAKGELLIQIRDVDRARKILKDVLTSEPGNFRAKLALGKHYYNEHYPRQATAYLEQAVEVAPPERKAEALRLLASSLSDQGDRVRAVGVAEQAVAADPSDIASIASLTHMYLQAEKHDSALQRAKALLELTHRSHAASPADRAALEQLISAYQVQIRCLVGYYTLLHKRDSRGRPTDQLEPGKEAEAARVLREIAESQEEAAKLTWELSYHQTLQVIEPVAGLQNEEEVRARLENNTGHLLTLAGLFWATHQTDRAVELFQRILSLQTPSDPNPADVRRNQDTARQFLEQHGLPLSATPAAETPAP